MTNDNTNITKDSIIVPFNPDNINTLTWFNGDCQNLKHWCSYLFDTQVDMSNPELQNVKSAALNFLAQVQDDVDKISEILKKY